MLSWRRRARSAARQLGGASPLRFRPRPSRLPVPPRESGVRAVRPRPRRPLLVDLARLAGGLDLHQLGADRAARRRTRSPPARGPSRRSTRCRARGRAGASAGRVIRPMPGPSRSRLRRSCTAAADRGTAGDALRSSRPSVGHGAAERVDAVALDEEGGVDGAVERRRRLAAGRHGERLEPPEHVARVVLAGAARPRRRSTRRAGCGRNSPAASGTARTRSRSRAIVGELLDDAAQQRAPPRSTPLTRELDLARHAGERAASSSWRGREELVDHRGVVGHRRAEADGQHGRARRGLLEHPPVPAQALRRRRPVDSASLHQRGEVPWTIRARVRRRPRAVAAPRRRGRGPHSSSLGRAARRDVRALERGASGCGLARALVVVVVVVVARRAASPSRPRSRPSSWTGAALAHALEQLRERLGVAVCVRSSRFTASAKRR